MRLDKSPERVLVIVMRYLGDVLLSTALLHSLRAAFPKSQLDVLVFSDTAAMLEGNPEIDSIIETRQGAGIVEAIRLILRLFRKYDLAFVTQTGDRPMFYSLVAAPVRVGAVPPRNQKGWWKRFFFQFWVEFDDRDTHTVLQHLKLARSIGIEPDAKLIPPRGSNNSGPRIGSLQKKRFAVLHTYPQWHYKRWTIEGWVAVGRFLDRQGLRLVLSGGPGEDEIAYIREIHRRLPSDTINLAGKVSIAELADLISEARLFIGPDTGITHLAAATGVPVIALFGPSNPVKWAPWPYRFDWAANPFDRIGSADVKNVHLVQGEKDCVPCHLEGCERHRDSHSECLDMLPASRVIAKIADVLARAGDELPCAELK